MLKIELMAYTIDDIINDNITPQGDWLLLSRDRTEILGRFWDGNFLRHVPSIGNNEKTLTLKAG